MVRLRAYRDQLAALLPPAGASAHDRVDYLLVRADLEGDWWSRTVLRSLQRNPSVYEGECSNGIFSIVNRQYASDEVRVRAAIARLRACPHVLDQGQANLTQTVREFAQIASEDIRDGDSLYTTTLTEAARDTSPETQRALAQAQSVALTALHAYRAWLDAHMSSFHAGGFAVGRAGIRLVSPAHLDVAVRLFAGCRNRPDRVGARSSAGDVGGGRATRNYRRRRRLQPSRRRPSS